MSKFLRFMVAIALALPVVLVSNETGAIPIFARRYQTACTTCHYGAFPQLNAFGTAFRDNGYRIPPDDEVYVKIPEQALGAEPWKKVFPKAVWPGFMPGIPPFSMQVFSDFFYLPHRREDTGKSYFDGVGQIKLLAAGNLGDSLSFFGSLNLSIVSPRGLRTSETLLERLFAVYTPKFLKVNLPTTLNIQLGRFEPRAAPFRDHTSLLGQIAPDFANSWAVVPASNFTTFFPAQNGVELFGDRNGPGGKGGLRWAIGIVNGEPSFSAISNFGLTTLGGPVVAPVGGVTPTAIATGVQRQYGHGLPVLVPVDGLVEGDLSIPLTSMRGDVNNAKDYYARVEYKIGGMGVQGGTTASGEAAPTLKMTQNWQDTSLTLGGFFYRGEQGAFNFIPTSSVLRPTTVSGVPASTDYDKNANHYWRFGSEAKMNWRNLELTGAATFFRDNVMKGVRLSNRTTGPIGYDFITDIYTAKLDWVALPWLIPSFRFENVNPDYDVLDMKSFNRYTALTTILLRANVKLGIAGIFTGDTGGPRTQATDNQYMATLQVGF